MSARPIGDLAFAREAANQALEQFVSQLTACRECGRTAGFFDRICRHCGAGTPVRIPISASVMITAVVAQIAILLLHAM